MAGRPTPLSSISNVAQPPLDDEPRGDPARRLRLGERGAPRSPRRRSSARWSAPGRSSARRRQSSRRRPAARRSRPGCPDRRPAGRTPPGAAARRRRGAANFGAGMRAKAENSSTMRPMSPTWRMMVSVQRSKVSRSLGDLLAVLAPQPLGRELDRRQRVLDLVGDAAGDVPPGGVALGGDQPGDVVEGQHQAVGAVADAQAQTARLAGRAPRRRPPRPRRPVVGGALRRRPGTPATRSRKRLALRASPGSSSSARGLAVHDRDAAGGIEADHAGADAQQHRLDELAARFGLVVGRSAARSAAPQDRASCG